MATLTKREQLVAWVMMAPFLALVIFFVGTVLWFAIPELWGAHAGQARLITGILSAYALFVAGLLWLLD